MYGKENNLDFSSLTDRELMDMFSEIQAAKWEPYDLPKDGKLIARFHDMLKLPEWACDPFGHATGDVLGRQIMEASALEMAIRYANERSKIKKGLVRITVEALNGDMKVFSSQVVDFKTTSTMLIPTYVESMIDQLYEKAGK